MKRLTPEQLFRQLWERAHPPGRPTVPNLTEAKVKAIVTEYTGDEPVTVRWVPDPNAPSCTAVRATFAKGRVLDLVVYHHTAGNDVEEVEFKHWPPRSI
jgi:hypothetical protein